MQPIDLQPKLVLFDLDDTLAATSSARIFRLRLAMQKALDRLASSPSVDVDRLVEASAAVSDYETEHFHEVLKEHGIEDREAASHAQTWLLGNRFHGLELFPEAIESVLAIRASFPGRIVGMITNGPEDIQAPKIKLLEIAPYFDFILISGAFGAHKPDPSIFEEAMRKGEATPEESIHIGDLPEYDIQGAHNAGISSVWMNHSKVEEYPEGIEPADFEVTTLRDLRILLGAT